MPHLTIWGGVGRVVEVTRQFSCIVVVTVVIIAIRRTVHGDGNWKQCN